MNCNPLNDRDLCDVCDDFGFKNMIKDHTCFKADIPTLVDVFVTNNPMSFSGAINADTCSNDFHNFIGVTSKLFAPLFLKRKVVYRTMQHSSDKSFQNDLDKVPFHNILAISWRYLCYLLGTEYVIYISIKYAPFKVKFINKPQVPYMNSEVRKAMHNRNMWRGKPLDIRRINIPDLCMYIGELRLSSYEHFLSKITAIDGAIQNITHGFITKRCAHFSQISLHPTTVISSSVMMEILSLIPHRSLISLICIIRPSRHITVSPMGLILLPRRMLY